MNISTAQLTLYTAITLLSLNGLFANGLDLDVVSITFARSILAGISIFFFIAWIKGKLNLANPKTYLLVYIIGLLMGLHWVSFFYAMQSSSVAIGMLSLYTFPIMTVLIEPFFANSKIHKQDIALGVLVLAGLFIIVKPHLTLESPTVLWGIVSGVASALLFTLRNMLQKFHCANIPSETLMLHQLVAIVLMLAAFIDVNALTGLDSTSWFYLCLLGIITTAFAHTLLVKSYKLFPAKSVAMVSCLQPVFGALFAWLILSEAITLNTIIGGSIILGVAIYESTKAPA